MSKQIEATGMGRTSGGPSYPYVAQPDGADIKISTTVELARDMSLRDWFAGQQMIRIASGWPNDETMKEIAARCYAMADAFLAERAKP